MKSNLNTNLRSLESEFLGAKINTSEIAFYDLPNFLKKEQVDPTYLENYAAYVKLRNYNENYIKKASIEIPFIAGVLQKHLVTDGRLGACVDYSMLLCRILEKQGYWNYIVKGSVTIEFPKEANLKNRYFWSFDVGTSFAAAHAWIVAPPFNVIDLTIKQQPYANGEQAYLPDLVINSDYKTCTIDEIDLISPDFSYSVDLQGFRGNKLMMTKVNYKEFMGFFKPCLVEVGAVKMKYITVGISVPMDTLEKMDKLTWAGKYGTEIYNDLIKPGLLTLRNSS